MVCRSGFASHPYQRVATNRGIVGVAGQRRLTPSFSINSRIRAKKKTISFKLGRPSTVSHMSRARKSRIFRVKSRATWLPGFEPVTSVSHVPSSNHSTQYSIVSILDFGSPRIILSRAKIDCLRP